MIYFLCVLLTANDGDGCPHLYSLQNEVWCEQVRAIIVNFQFRAEVTDFASILAC